MFEGVEPVSVRQKDAVCKRQPFTRGKKIPPRFDCELLQTAKNSLECLRALVWVFSDQSCVIVRGHRFVYAVCRNTESSTFKRIIWWKERVCTRVSLTSDLVHKLYAHQALSNNASLASDFLSVGIIPRGFAAGDRGSSSGIPNPIATPRQFLRSVVLDAPIQCLDPFPFNTSL